MLTLIERKIGDNKDLDFTLNLTDYHGKIGADITDVIFVVKKNKGDADDALFIKKASLNEITFAGQELVNVLVHWDYNEYANFKAKKKYIAAVYPLFSGDTVADENSDYEFEIVFIDDTLKEN